MKIEMGESLVLSWLRHIEKCQLVQLNWKVSNCWEGYNSEEAKTLYENIKIHFPVFKNNSNLEQLIKQAELDALGVSFNNNNCEYHAVDIAYHENGLNYGSTQETIERIQKKLLRSALVLYMQFNIKTGKIYFLSPKINPVVIFDLKEKIEQVESYMKNNGFNFEFVVIANSDFKSKILTPLLDKLNCIADTSELFMRSIQLLNVCNNYETNENTVCNNETLINKKHAKIFSGQKHKGYQKEKIENGTKKQILVLKETTTSPKSKVNLSRQDIKNICKSKGYNVNVTFNIPSKNATQDVYWVNPKVNHLKEDWTLVLNDNINKTLYCFDIPANSIHYSLIKMKNQEEIDFQINYRDLNFTDKRSGLLFKKWLVKTIDY